MSKRLGDLFHGQPPLIGQHLSPHVHLTCVWNVHLLGSLVKLMSSQGGFPVLCLMQDRSLATKGKPGWFPFLFSPLLCAQPHAPPASTALSWGLSCKRRPWTQLCELPIAGNIHISLEKQHKWLMLNVLLSPVHSFPQTPLKHEMCLRDE